MIPNTDINCSKCATPMYSDCVMWSGADLSCLLLTKDCCDTSITDVINKLGAYICNFSNVTDYMFPFCFDSYSISDFHGMQQAMLTQICVLQSEIGPLDFNWGCYSSGVTSSVTLAIQRLIDETCAKLTTQLTWGCTTSGTTNSINDSLQAIINAQNSQKISYNSSHFVVSGSSGSCNQGLSLKQGQWVPFLPYKRGGTNTTAITKRNCPGTAVTNTVEVSNGFALINSGLNPSNGYTQPQMFAYLDALGYVTVVGAFTIGILAECNTNGRGDSTNTYYVGSGITSAYVTVSGNPGTFSNENGSGTIVMSSPSGVYMDLFTMPPINGVIYYPGMAGIAPAIPPAAVQLRGEVTTCGYGINFDNKYYTAPSGSPSGSTNFSATYSKCLNYPDAEFPVYLTYSKGNNGLDVYVQPMWVSDSKIPITLYVKFTFNINN